MPDRRDILGQPQNALSFLGRDEESGGLGQCEILALQLLHLPQLLIPVSFQAASYEPIVRIDGDIATTGQISLILRPLQPELPLPIQLLSAGLQMIECRQGNSEMGWLDRFQETGRHGLIDAIAPHSLTGLLSQLRMGLSALIAGRGAILQVAHMHAATAGPTQHDPLQERRSFAHRPTSLLWPPGPIVIEELLVVAKLVPTNIARMRVQEHNRPVLTFHLARSPLHARLLAGKRMLTGFGSPIYVGTGIERVVQQGKDTPTS